MRMKIQRWSFICSIVFLVSGCGTVDATKQRPAEAGPPLCEIHHSEMAPDLINVRGEIVYMGGYWEICRTQFPHHGGHRYNNETATTPFERNVIDFVCPECDRAYHEYLQAQRQE